MNTKSGLLFWFMVRVMRSAFGVPVEIAAVGAGIQFSPVLIWLPLVKASCWRQAKFVFPPLLFDLSHLAVDQSRAIRYLCVRGWAVETWQFVIETVGNALHGKRILIGFLLFPGRFNLHR